MKKSRCTESQIVAVLREYDADTPIADLARRHGIHANTVRLWKSKYGGLDVSDLARLKQLEDEHSRMRRVITNLTLENDAIKSWAQKTSGALAAQRSREGTQQNRTERTGACRLVDCPRATIQDVFHREPGDPAVIDSVRKIASQHLRYGRRRVYFLDGPRRL